MTSAVAMRSFGFGEQLVRVFDRQGGAWFVANDVCGALEIGNASQAVSRLDEDERDAIITNDSAGRDQRMTIVSESGVYSLIFTSRKVAAKKFRRWVTGEVLPALRRTGMYVMPDDDGPAAPDMELPDALDAMRTKLALAKEVRVVFGMKAAREAWRTLALLPELTDGLPEPERSSLSHQVLQAVHRTVLDWMDARTMAAPGHRHEAMALWNDYIDWARRSEVDPDEIVSLTAFGRALTNCGIVGFKSGRRVRIGLRLVAQD